MDILNEILQWLVLIWLVASVRNIARGATITLRRLHERIMRLENLAHR